MADYYPLIARAIAGLEKNTGENRRVLYERARSALVGQLRSVEPPLGESDVTRERLALEEAIRKVESEAARKSKLELTERPKPRPAEPAAREEPARATELPARQAAGSPTPRSVPRPSAPQMPRAVPMGSAAAAREARYSEPEEDRQELPADPVPPPRSPLRPVPENGRHSLRDAGLRDFREVVAEANELGEASAQAARSAREMFNTTPVDQPELRLDPPRVLDREPSPRREPVEPRMLDRDPAPSERPDFDGPAMLEPAINLDDSRATTSRPRPTPEPELEPEMQPPSSLGRIIKTATAVAVVACVVALVVWQWPSLVGLYQWMRAPGPEVTAKAPEPEKTKPKINDRIEATSADTTKPAAAAPAPAAAVAQKVVLYEEDPADPQGKRFVGSAVWRSETVSPGPGQSPDVAIRADIQIPERKLAMTWSLRRNSDKTLPASHTIEIIFKLPPEFQAGGIANVPGILMKQAEQTRGVPLAGLAVKVTNGYFLIGLSAVETDKDRNMQLLKERAWFDVPMVYGNNRRAILAIEKGTPGERVFADAFKAWGQ
jgi:hypothetical protein